MIEPTEADIGTRRVYYKKSWMKPEDYEYGYITGFNESFVFVRYGKETQSKATRREDLFWDTSRFMTQDEITEMKDAEDHVYWEWRRHKMFG